MKNLIIILFVAIVAFGCSHNKEKTKPIPKTVTIYWGNNFMSLERYDRDKNLIEKIGATFITYQLSNCDDTDSTIKYIYTYENGIKVKEEEIEMCLNEIRERNFTYFKYNNQNELSSSITTDSIGDTLSVSDFTYVKDYRIKTYKNFKENDISVDTFKLNSEGKVRESKIYIGNLLILYINKYDEDGAQSSRREIHIENGNDTVRDRLGKYYYNEYGYLEEIRMVKTDSAGNINETPWINYKFDYYKDN